jgi:pyridoxal/pyridoxine/pyridoxamine kinase
MEEKMPSDILVSSLSASDEGISMSVTTNSKASAAEAIIQLRSFTGIGNITCTGISETTDENGKTTDSFQVSVVYVEEEAADEEQQSQN